jgi:hypothetical protein
VRPGVGQLAAGLVAGLLGAPALAGDLGLPLSCRLGENCFVQQFADMDPGPGAGDPFCGAATYDGHDGTDFRVLSLADVRRGVAVLAAGSGTVLRARDGTADRLVRTAADREAVRDRECGNGLLVRQDDGLDLQYCHMREGSVAVRPGERVRQGQRLGAVGASGLAEFAHLHLTVRRDGETLEPLTGRPLAAGCTAGPAAPLFTPAVAALIGRGAPQVIASGVADRAVEEDGLSEDGPAPTATSASPATVGWGWLINLAKGDGITLRLVAPGGGVVGEETVPPLPRSKATYVLYAGRRRPPTPGAYVVEVSVLRGGREVAHSRSEVDVR